MVEHDGDRDAGPGVLLGQAPTSAPGPPHLDTDADTAADDLVRLVLILVDTVRELMERQAIRRVESGGLSDDQVERLGLTLLRLEERMAELKARFGLRQEDLALRIGTVGDLVAALDEEDAAGGTGR